MQLLKEISFWWSLGFAYKKSAQMLEMNAVVEIKECLVVIGLWLQKHAQMVEMNAVVIIK